MKLSENEGYKLQTQLDVVADTAIQISGTKRQSKLQSFGKALKYTNKTKLHGLNPRANYTDRATAASRRSDCQLLRIKDATWSA
jgi:hypothetical protein